MASSTKATRVPKERTYPLMSAREIESLIAEGRKLIIVDQWVLKIDAWLPFHPGGDKALLHMVGRDATDETTAFHSAETKAMMMKYRVGRIEGYWDNFVPPIQGGRFRKVGDKTTSPDLGSTAGSTTASNASESSSREMSPIFDTDASPPVRQRQKTTARSPSASSTGSADAETRESGSSEKQQQVTPTAFLDMQTKKEISLDLDKYPRLDPKTQEDIVHRYRELHDRIQAQGLYQCNYTAYLVELSRYTLLFSCMVIFLRWGWYIPSAISLGMLWHQLVFTVHDAGHIGITHNFHFDTCVGIICADWIGGLSVGWWKRNHNVHHIVTNSPEHDPDIEHLPFLAISHRFLGELTSSYYEHLMAYDAVARVFVAIQAYSYYFLMLFGRFNLYRLSWDHLVMRRGPRKGPAWWHWHFEVAGQFFFWAWFGYGIVYKSIPDNWNRFFFVLVSHMLQSPLHVQITLSHFAMSTAELGPAESFPQKMLRTTMDIDCPPWLDFFHGGLQFQVIHHLFPRIPRHNLRQTQKLVQEFCDDVGIPYALYGFVEGNKEVIGQLDEVSRQAAIFKECQRAIAAGHV